MELSMKRKIILWVTVILIVIFLGLETGYSYKKECSTLTFYGFSIGSNKPFWGELEWNKKAKDDNKLLYKIMYGRNIANAVYLGNYKYQLIVATLLIGLALFMTVKRK